MQTIRKPCARKYSTLNLQRERIKVKHAQIEEKKHKVFETKINDNTVKNSFYVLDEAVSKRNRMQTDLMSKYKDKGELLSAIQAISGNQEGYLKKSDIFDLYKKSLNKDNLTLEEKQRVFKFSENLRFREDNRNVCAEDFADLVFG